MAGNNAESSSKDASPRPDPRLRTLDKLVGTWKLAGRNFGSDAEWYGHQVYEWMEGGFFLAMRGEQYGEEEIKGIMLIGYERGWQEDDPSKEIMGHWFESTTGNHFIYVWEVDDKNVTFWFGQRDAPAAFKGIFSTDHNTITGTWKWPGGGYDLTMTRVEARPGMT